MFYGSRKVDLSALMSRFYNRTTGGVLLGLTQMAAKQRSRIVPARRCLDIVPTWVLDFCAYGW